MFSLYAAKWLVWTEWATDWSAVTIVDGSIAGLAVRGATQPLGFFDQWHSSGPHSTLSTRATSTWLISSTCSLRMVPAPRRERADNPSPALSEGAISLPRHSLWSQFYAVHFDLGSYIQMLVSHPRWSLEEHVSLPQECPSAAGILATHSFINAPSRCCPFKTDWSASPGPLRITRRISLWLICSRQDATTTVYLSALCPWRWPDLSVWM